ncbi:hypothetical protein A3H16_03910 [Candidatus Kaiserbacteria bacterium RIFCSPLOWO2_12_FULL_53_8]|uniref:HTH deoR-type domain-containing protein n=2 Tax=Candidatus Kaiseribacteriota TaxID=1752734 RepID=A0A1F6CUN0_9BACT|nr:MAG: hypothetical protein A2851_04715 [Candidatus Kaiserbacteria bacterium RIFCSPHIGHO2_01_FULL_53_29]OGG90843.1 MAG: hypothetical protein A3H16_03910 [Candidatus Kaiserbacteria bacterium RIFCSPLOWO2_12_FULL_53_8]
MQRDIQKPDPLSRFFDKNSVRTNPFGANQSADRAYRRAERIVAALYLVTNHIPPGESLRVSVRTGALLILDNVLSLRDEMRATDSNHVQACRASIRHLISLVRMLAVSGFLSIQNTTTVIEGLDELGNFLGASQNSPLSENIALSREDLLDIGGGLKDIKDSRSIKDKVVVKDINILSDKKPDSSALSVREQGIIAILRSGGELGIKDICANLPEYSEKMIQRDLVVLVGAGRVKKTGLKRWSRYSLAR